MGKSSLLIVLGIVAAAVIAGNTLLHADATEADRTARSQRHVLAERAAVSGLDAGASALLLDFSWRDGFGTTDFGGATFAVSATGTAAGPVQVRSIGQSTPPTGPVVEHLAETLVARLGAAPAALVLDGPNAEFVSSGSDWSVSGDDARGRSLFLDRRPDEGSGYGDDRPALWVRTAGSIAAESGMRAGDASDVVASGGSADVSALVALAESAPDVAYAGDYTFDDEAVGTAGRPDIVHVAGDATLSGSTVGYGLLVVDGALDMRGDAEWNGLVLVRGGEASLNDRTAVVGALYVLAEVGYMLGAGTYPPHSLWAVDDETGRLHWFVVASDGVAQNDEGMLSGLLAGSTPTGDRADIEGLTFAPDGTGYFVNNAYYDEGLYRIAPTAFDGDASTPIPVTRIGDVGVDDWEESFGLVWHAGALYSISGGTRKVYRMNLTTGAAETVSTFTAGDPGSYFTVGGLAEGPGGSVYTNRLTPDEERLELWRFDAFPTGDPVFVMELGDRARGFGIEESGAPLTIHPDGTAYIHPRTELRAADIATGTLTQILPLAADIDAVSVFYAGESGSGGGGGGAGTARASLQGRASVQYSAEAIGALAARAASVAASARVVAYDRFGRDL